MTKIREIINKYGIDVDIDKGTAWSYPFVCIRESDFDKLEKELASLMFIKTMDHEVLKLMLMGVDALKEGVIAQGEEMTKIRAILDSVLVPCGYRTVHIGEPYEVSAIQFLYKKTIDKLETELIEYVKDENCEAYGEGMTDSVTGFKIEDNPQMRETEKPKKAEDERDHFADSE